MDVFPALVGVGVGHTVTPCVTREGQACCLSQSPQHFRPHQQCVGAPASPHPHQHVFLSSFDPGGRDAVSARASGLHFPEDKQSEHWPFMYLLWRSVCADTLTRICLFLKMKANDSTRRLPESSMGVAAFVGRGEKVRPVAGPRFHYESCTLLAFESCECIIKLRFLSKM